MIEETLVGLVERFNRHARQNPGVREELRGKNRVIQLDLTNGETYHFELRDGELTFPRTGNGRAPDVRILTDLSTFEGLVRKEIGPIKAMFSGRLRVEATLEDKILLRRLISP
jgi:putative sterol carrier protein